LTEWHVQERWRLGDEFVEEKRALAPDGFRRRSPAAFLLAGVATALDDA
jgi:hypothetical protein